MACECIRSIEARVKEKVLAENPTWRIIDDGFANKALFFGKDAVTKITLPIEFEYKHPTKKGGESALRHHKVNMMGTFCPFCGIPYDSSEEGVISNEELYRMELCEARDILLQVSLIDKTNTCDKAIERADKVLGIDDHKTSISILDRRATDGM